MNKNSGLKIRNLSFLAFFLVVIGAFLRFYNLNWGAPYYFHPDERNIVDLVIKSSLANPQSLLKGTFAYGNFPVVLTLLLKPLFLPFFHLFKIADPFAQIVIILRFISASFSILPLYVIYLCGRFWSEKIALLSLFLAVFSAGLIQQAHFGTYDGFVAFAALTTFYFLLKFIKSKKALDFYLSLIFIALGAGAKINILILGIFPILILFLKLKKRELSFLQTTKHTLLGILSLVLLTLVLSPYYLTADFRTSLIYEQGLVRGVIPVFYTQSFSGTIPVLFQFLHILPFLINPLLTIIFVPAFFALLIHGAKTRNKTYLLLTTSYLILFLPQAFFFAKWTRYMVPTLPFIYLIISIATLELVQHFKKVLSIKYLVFSIFIVINFIFGISYFITAFVRPDTRIAASNFARSHIQRGARILTEPYDLGIMPFNGLSPGIKPFNFYELDNNAPDATEQALNTELQTSDYVILPSQRLLRSRLLNKDKFPKGNSIYSLLDNEALGYQKIYDTPCDIFCKIAYSGDPTFQFEETATVFDRPTVFIFKKIE